jgi:hypothetical protein
MTEIDPRAVWFLRAEALGILVREGEVSLDVAVGELIDPFLSIVGSAPNPCPICGDPPCRHDDLWCEAVREAEAKRNIEAIMRAVSADGLTALKHPDNLQRIHRCDDRARAEINARIANLEARTAI